MHVYIIILSFSAVQNKVKIISHVLYSFDKSKIKSELHSSLSLLSRAFAAAVLAALAVLASAVTLMGGLLSRSRVTVYCTFRGPPFFLIKGRNVTLKAATYSKYTQQIITFQTSHPVLSETIRKEEQLELFL